MPVSTKHLIDAVNKEVLDTTNPKLDVAIANAKIYDELQSSVFSVPDVASLPPATENTGRLIWVTSLNDYRYSDGSVWIRDFNSTLKTTRSLWAWGENYNSRLGDGTYTDRSSPVSVIGGFTDWCSFGTGESHVVAVRTNGSAWSWGKNSYAQLGDNSTIERSSPISVVGGMSWCVADGGRSHSLAISSNGTLWAWGYNNCGHLGTNSTVSSSSPVSVVGGFTDWCQVSAGRRVSAGVRSNCSIWMWGTGASGQLGNNLSANQSSPVSVVGGFTDWCGVSIFSYHALGIRTNGTIWSWGWGSGGRLGDGTTLTQSSPVSVVGGFTDWCQVSAGWRHSTAIRTNGTLWTWGDATGGDLGDNSLVNKSSPVSVVGGFTDWCQVSAGFDNTAALRTNGTMWTWGRNYYGQLGINAMGPKSSPVSVVGGFTGWDKVSSGSYFFLASKAKTSGF